MPIERVTARVTGRVQGVGFRYFVQARARSLGLTGWVKNELDGSVSFVAEGDRSVLNELVLAAENGPSMSRVSHVSTFWGEASGEYAAFQIR